MWIIGNLLWFILGGWIIGIEYLLGGVSCCLTIVGIPFGLQLFKLAGVACFPFKKEIVPCNNPTNGFKIAMNLIWFLFGGIWAVITHLALALLFAVTIVGIPFAQQHFQLASLALAPFGRSYQKLQ